MSVVHLLSLSLRVFVGALRFLVAAARGAKALKAIGKDALKARRSLRGGVFYCPDNHVIPTEAVVRCSACGFTYTGSIWRCEYAECGAVTPYVNCPVAGCGLSVRSPYRWGRP